MEILVVLGGGLFCALSNSAANLEPIEIWRWAVAMRRKATAVICLVRSVG
jgi:hypothetical protein